MNTPLLAVVELEAKFCDMCRAKGKYTLAIGNYYDMRPNRTWDVCESHRHEAQLEGFTVKRFIYLAEIIDCEEPGKGQLYDGK